MGPSGRVRIASSVVVVLMTAVLMALAHLAAGDDHAATPPPQSWAHQGSLFEAVDSYIIVFDDEHATTIQNRVEALCAAADAETPQNSTTAEGVEPSLAPECSLLCDDDDEESRRRRTVTVHSSLVLAYVVRGVRYPTLRAFLDSCELAQQVASLERNQLARVGAAQESEPSTNVQGTTNETNTHEVHELAGEEHAGTDRAPMGGYPHNLDRLDQRSLPYDGRFEPLSGGAGTVVYVVDSGVRASHSEFRNLDVGAAAAGASRVRAAVNFVSPSLNWGEYLRRGGDCYGHGTIVASLAAGNLRGVAPRATLVDVRVLDCDGLGTVSDVIAGLEYVAREHPRQNMAGVVTLSLGLSAGASSLALEQTVRALIDRHHVSVVTAAGNWHRLGVPMEGNSDGDSCALSPANVDATLTVAASSDDDSVWPNSNTGRCVDIFAPGDKVGGASIAGDHTFSVWSGTSMSVPHVAGAVAIFAHGDADLHPHDIKRRILAAATKRRIFARPQSIVLSRTPNRLLYVGRQPTQQDSQQEGVVSPSSTTGADVRQRASDFVTMALPPGPQTLFMEAWGT